MSALLAESSSSLTEIIVVSVAAAGGIIVFVGLGIEKIADVLDSKFLGEYRAHKSLELAGWCILMFGIIVEIGVAIWSANDAWQTRQMAIENAPNNQPISFVSAQAILVQIGTNRNTIDPLRFGTCNVRIGSSEETNFWMSGGMIWNLRCSSCQTVEREDTNGKNTEWILDFKQDMFVPGFNGLVKDSSKWDVVKLVAAFLPTDSVVWGGTFRLTVNSTNRDFNIPQQKVSNSSSLENFAKNPPKTVTVFTW